MVSWFVIGIYFTVDNSDIFSFGAERVSSFVYLLCVGHEDLQVSCILQNSRSRRAMVVFFRPTHASMKGEQKPHIQYYRTVS